MAINPTDFKARYPEFVSVLDARVQTPHLDDAVLEVGAGAWGTLYERGVFLLTAHTLAMDPSIEDDIDGGDTVDDSRITSRKVGDVAVSFSRGASASSDEDWYLQTRYGSDYLRLKKRVGIGMVAVGGV